MSGSVTHQLTPGEAEALHDDVATRLKRREKFVRDAWREIKGHSDFPTALEQAREELTEHCQKHYGAEPSDLAVLMRAAEIICDKYHLPRPF